MASRKPHIAQSPAGDRNSLTISTGGQLLETQQTIKSFLLTLKTRALTDHERAEFNKTRSLLESALQQRLQAAPTTATAADLSMNFNIKAATKSPGASSEHQLKVNPISTLRPSALTSWVTQSSSQNTKQCNILRPSTMFDLPPSQKASQSSPLRRPVSSKLNRGKPIQLKLEIYRDPGNVTSAMQLSSSSPRNVQVPRGKETTLDKENDDSTGKVPRGVLTEKPLNNPNTPVAARQETLFKNPKEANQQKAYDSNAFTHLGRLKQPKDQQRTPQGTQQGTQQAVTTTTTPRKRPFNDENEIYPTKQHATFTSPAIKVIRVQSPGESRIEEAPLRISESSRVDYQYLSRKLAEAPQDESKPNARSYQQPITPSISSPSRSENEVPASVEDEGTSTSLDELLARHKVKVEPLSQKQPSIHETVSQTKDIDEIEDSQSSKNSDAHDTIDSHVTTESQHSLYSLPTTIDTFDSHSHDSEDETAPQPGFLLGNVPEPEKPAAADVDEIEGSEEETLLRCDFLEDLPEHGRVSEIEDDSDSDGGCISFPSSDVSRRGSTNLDAGSDSLAPQSTDCVDNVWCIDGFRNVILSTACGHKDPWIAIETQHHVQFWYLESTSEGKWIKKSQHYKTASRYTQVLFAQDDSYALIIDYTQQCYTKVPLSTSDAVSSVTWQSVAPNNKLDAFIRLDVHGDDSIVMGAEEAGSLLRVHVKKDVENSVTCIPAKLLYYAEAAGAARSICAVQNTRSLVAAVFGQEVVLWNASDLQNTPIAVINTSSIAALPVVDIISTSVPSIFAQDYAEMILSGALPPSQWPILAVIRMSGLDNSSLDQDQDQCGLYVMREKAIQLVHKYKGSRDISSISCSSRYVACHINSEGKDILRLWDILHPEPALALSLVDPSFVTCKRGDVGLSRDSAKATEAETECLKRTILESEEKEASEDEEDSSLSSSTLSLPPSDMSWSQEETTSDDQTLLDIPPKEILDSVKIVKEISPSCTPTPGPRLAQSISQGQDKAKPRKEWIELESVACEEQKVLFSLHPNQHKMIVVQQDRRGGKIANSPVASSTSSVHVMDLEPLLPLTSL
ncbi:hypothetical protein BGZ81_006841 [Podila clonocystis]|nr:hypothetical protein BGZ81_006841 [Podila clonocystis]